MKIVLMGKEEGMGMGGISVFVERYKTYLEKHGHQVFELRFTKEKKNGSNVHRIPYYYAEKRSMVLVPAISSLSLIRNKLSEIKPDIVYTSIATSPLDFYLPKLCHNLHLPIAAVWHGDISRKTRMGKVVSELPFRAFMPVCRGVDLLHVFTPELKNFYAERGVEENRIVVIPNGVDSGFYCRGNSQFAKKNNIKRGVLLLGRVTTVKNPEWGIEAFLDLDPPEDYKLVVLGTGDQLDFLKSEYSDPRVIYTGLISDQRAKLDVMRACQVFMLPSRFEGMPLSLLEAMAMEMGCIATNVGSTSEALGDAGIVLSYGEARRNLYKALARLMYDRELALNLGRKARQRVRRDFEEKRVFEKITLALHQTTKAAKY